MKFGLSFLLSIFILEFLAKVILFNPYANASLVKFENSSSAFRIRWVYRYLATRGSTKIYYPFDAYDRLKGWNLKPGLRKYTYGGFMLNSNSQGIRGTAEYTLEKHDSVQKRILAIGDSFTFGDDIDDDETYPAMLQSLLGPQYEVLNMGIHGYGHDQSLLKLEQEGLKFKPDIIIFAYGLWDKPRNLLNFRDYAKPRFILKNGRLELRDSPISSPKSVLIQEIFKFHFLDLVRIIASGLSNNREAAHAEKLSLEIIRQMGHLAKEVEASLVVLYLPYRELFAPSLDRREEEALMPFAQKEGLFICNPTTQMRATSKKQKMKTLFLKDLHYAPILNRDLAQVLQECLQKYRLL